MWFLEIKNMQTFVSQSDSNSQKFKLKAQC